MATIPLWLIGRTVTAVVVTPQIANSAGVLSNSVLGAQSFTTVVDEIQYSGSVTTAEISALTAARQNPVVIEEDGTMVVTEIMRSAAGSVIAAAIWTATTGDPAWALFQFSRGGNSISMYGLLTRYEETVTRGKSVARLTIRIVDDRAASSPITYGAAFAA